MHNNPYLRGKASAEACIRNSIKSVNPYPEFSEKWALFNKGYNSVPQPERGPSGAYWPREYIQLTTEE